MMIPELLLVILLIVGLVRASGDSVHPEERNNPSHDPLNPDMLQCQNTTIEVKDGDTVILPCSTKDKMDISYEEVEWKFKDPTTGEDKTVHWYYQGEDFLHKQSDDFKDRTSIFKEELSSGNCSLSLLVTTSHSGRYHGCVVIDGKRHDCLVNLKVLPKGEDSSRNHQNVTVSPDKPLNGTDGQKKIIGGVVVVALIIIIALGLYCYLKHHSSGIKPNNPEPHRSASYQAQRPPQNQENNPADPNQNEDRSQMIEN